MIEKLNYIDGKITSNQTYYYSDGNKFSEGKMLNEKEDGAWRYYGSNGEQIGIVKYKNGIQLYEKDKRK